VAVVGARAATAYGEHVAVEFAYGLAASHVTVVSGGAFGIDVCAHRGALAADGPTVLVSAAGLDRPYPSAHSRLYDEVAESGLLVSESPPGCAPHRHRFLSRNRIIAALSSSTVVIEAALRSGALNTAGHCVSLGRPLLAVPGPVTSAMSAGCHALINRPENPAQLVSSVDEIMAVIGPVSDRGVLINTDQPQKNNTYDDLEPTARVVLDGMPARSWAREDEIAARSGVAIAVVLQTLPVLRMGGYLEVGREGYRLSRMP
jgi:DNA processing protein